MENPTKRTVPAISTKREYKVRVSLPGSNGECRFCAGRVATREEQDYVQKQLNEFVDEQTRSGSMCRTNFKPLCKAFCEKNALVRKGFICEKCNTLFTKSCAFAKHRSWCTNENNKKRAKTLSPKSASYWAKSSKNGYASDFCFVVSGTTPVEHLFSAFDQAQSVTTEAITEAHAALNKKLLDPTHHQYEKKLQRCVVSTLSKLVGLDHCPQDNKLWFGGKMKNSETDVSLINETSEEIVGLFQAKRNFLVADLAVMFNQHCADLVAYVQHQLESCGSIDFKDLDSIRTASFAASYPVPLLFSLASSYVQILYVPDGICGSTVKAVSLGEESQESTLLHVVVLPNVTRACACSSSTSRPVGVLYDPMSETSKVA